MYNIIVHMKTLYSTTALATGDGRNGRAEIEDGSFGTDLRTPPELGGPGGAPNPEQLFAAGYAACFHSALKLVGAGDGLDVSGTEVSATVGLGMLPTGGFNLSVELDVHVPNVDKARAQELVEKTHTVCPYSNATRGNIEVALAVV